MTSEIERAARAIERAKALVITAGAGMGVDSGLPDFRGNSGFWKHYPPYERLGLGFASLANSQWFRDDPEMAWGFYGHRRNVYRKTTPHHGFTLLRRWGESKQLGAFVVTSNVDGHFQKSGFDGDRVHEVHGTIEHSQCLMNCGQTIHPADPAEIAIDSETMRAARPFPSCPSCGQMTRPNILMFGDWDWDPNRSAESETRFHQWLKLREKVPLAVVELGAGTAVPSIRLQSERLAGQGDVTLMRINPREPKAPAEHIGVAAGARETIEAIDRLLSGRAL